METILFKIVQIKNMFQKSILYIMIKKRIKKNIPKNNNNN
jgi:hypothetical protein